MSFLSEITGIMARLVFLDFTVANVDVPREMAGVNIVSKVSLAL